MIRRRLASETEVQQPLKRQCFDHDGPVVSEAADSALEIVRFVGETPQDIVDLLHDGKYCCWSALRTPSSCRTLYNYTC